MSFARIYVLVFLVAAVMAVGMGLALSVAADQVAYDWPPAPSHSPAIGGPELRK